MYLPRGWGSRVALVLLLLGSLAVSGAPAPWMAPAVAARWDGVVESVPFVVGPARRMSPPQPAAQPSAPPPGWRPADHDRPPVPEPPDDPDAPRQPGPPRQSETPLPRADTPRAPNDLRLFTNTAVAPLLSGFVSTTDEPSVAQVGNTIFYTGNWYAALSTNRGATWAFVNPYTSFPSAAGGFCCDQVTIYDPSRDITIWLLQYLADGAGNNIQRLAVARGQAGLASLTWVYVDVSAQTFGFPTSRWLDYPHFALGSNHLYLTTNAFTGGGSFAGSVAYRVTLDSLAALTPGGAISGSAITPAGVGTLTPAAGAGTTMYIATHATFTSLRVFAWSESSGSPTFTDVAHSLFLSGLMTCTGPDGTNMCGFSDTRVLTGWVAGGVIGFMWNARQGTAGLGTFAYPYVHVARVSQATMTLLDEPIIFNNAFAYAYPSVAVNARGHLGLTIAHAGAAQHPSTSIAVMDDLSPTTWTWQAVATGTHGPGRNRWGDYLTTRPAGGNGATWVAATFTQQGPCTSTFTSACDNVVPRFVWFGRERDDPTLPPGPTPTPTATATPGPGGANLPTTWYFAEGYTGAGFDQYLTIMNPNSTTAQVTITYYLPSGGPVTKNVNVSANARYTVTVHGTFDGVGRDQAVSARVTTTNGGGIVVERPMYFTYNGTVTGGHNVMGATALSTTWYFAEGYTGSGFDEYLTIMNPNSTTAPVTITYYLSGGGTVVKGLDVAANARATVNVHDTASGVGRDQAVSAKVTTTNPSGIVVERPMYFTYNGVITGGHNVMGATALKTAWYFAEGYTGAGFDQYLTIMNPHASAAPVSITYYLSGGGTVVKSLDVGANSRATVNVHDTTNGVGRDQANSANVTTTHPDGIVVERPMYFTYGGTVTGGHNVLGAPAPRPTWYFAEGYTGAGFDEYLTILNPNPTPATVTITYYRSLGGTVTTSLTVAANTRATVNVHDTTNGVGRDQAVSARVTTTNPGGIVVERPMYFTYNGTITGGHTVMGYAP